MPDHQSSQLSQVLREIQGSETTQLTEQQRKKLRQALLTVTKKRVYLASSRQAHLLRKAQKTYRRPLTAAVR